ncbi:hypothetical protein Q1695_013645 [Nippostrongylus brasiliensis]|nr:hypothetical protein Q1695_013638 [Nippostrongylus brasiliensis]WKX98101.1 hypothetical protein Q1695_013640 [Nippostrongylus brasiliensis]WKX98112.1 hypothetical protein Q1695_013645 [Nippostrongylus brasiliensis]
MKGSSEWKLSSLLRFLVNYERYGLQKYGSGATELVTDSAEALQIHNRSRICGFCGVAFNWNNEHVSA